MDRSIERCIDRQIKRIDGQICTVNVCLHVYTATHINICNMYIYVYTCVYRNIQINRHPYIYMYVCAHLT